jgi:hypothetical protein
MEAGLIRRVDNRNTKAWHYEIISKEEYNQLKSSIATALDEALQKVKQQPNGSTSAHKQNEPVKRRRIKQLDEQPTAA